MAHFAGFASKTIGRQKSGMLFSPHGPRNVPERFVALIPKVCTRAHQKIERSAVIAARDWQHWVIGAVRMFLHPEVRAYDKSHESEALQWIAG